MLGRTRWKPAAQSTKQKLQRRTIPVRFNRRMYELSPEEQEKNKAYQFYRLVEYLNEMPVIQIMVDGIEADDVVVLARSSYYKGRSKTCCFL